jgi:hypothetical protein
MGVPQPTSSSQESLPVDHTDSSDVLATWRRAERNLEAGLDPDLLKRLDELRAEDARLWRGSRYAIRSLDERAGPGPTLRRTG